MESPFHSVLHTNYVPTEREVDVITQLLLEPERRLKEMDTRIFQLREELRKITGSREELGETIAAHRAIIGLVRRVPDDILREIFIWTLPDSYLPRPCPDNPSLVLSHVCSRWRKIALSTPRLWSSLDLDLDSCLIRYADTDFNERRNALVLEQAVQWLQKAGAASLSLAFGSGIDPEGSRLGDIGKVLSSLPSTADSRITSLNAHIYSDFDPFIEQFEKAGFPNPFHSVQRLQLWIRPATECKYGPHYGPGATHAIKALFQRLDLAQNENLKALSLCLYFTEFTASRIDITPFLPCLQLTSLDLGGPNNPYLREPASSFTLRKILESCPNLSRLQAYIELETLEDEPGEPVVHRGLQQAAFQICKGSNDAPALSSVFTFPSLTFLHVALRSVLDGDIDTLRKFVHGFSPSDLTSMSIRTSHLSQDDCTSLLAALPSLVQLCLEEPIEIEESLASRSGDSETPAKADRKLGYDDLFLERLIPPRQGNVGSQSDTAASYLLPRLRYFKCEPMAADFSDKALLSLILARASHPQPLPSPFKQIHIHFVRDIEHDIRRDCAAVIASGLDIKLSYGDSDDYDDHSHRYWYNRRYFTQLDYFPYGWEQSG